ncbi:MAG: protein kinase, partial [Myxococcota bacterium]|nr:protein kinase [Myxococcota bacterium]
MQTRMPQEPVAATYLCQSVIGSGGMGEVMLAVDLNRGQQVALKLVRADRARKLRALRRFNREVRAMARLDHPSVVAVYDYGVHSDDDGVKRPFFVMEFVQGQSLRGFLNSKPTLEQAHPIFDHILSALAYAHARGVVHRDLKPENVLLSERDGELIPRILDFGIARMIDDELFEDVGTFDPDPIAFRILEDMSTIDASFDEENTQAIELRSSISRPDADEPGSNRITSLNQCVGTPAYLAPEQIRPKRQGVGPSADLYAFGVMLFELCGGHRPFRARTPQELLRLHLSQPVPAIQAQPHIHMPAGLAELIHRLLAKDPNERPFCAADVRRNLRAIFAGRGLPPPPVPSYDALSNSSLGNSQLRRTRRLKSALQPKLGTGLLRFRDPPLVGRDSEQHSIWQRLVGACENRQAHLVVLDGEAGIGKTRLLNWMRERCEELGIARTVNVSCDATQLGFGLREGLGRLLGTRSLDADAFEQRLRTELERLGLQRQESILRSFLHPKGAAVNRLAPVYAAFDAVLRRFSQERPLLLQLDDIHFTSDDVFELLQTLLESQLIDPYPALIVASLRGEYLFEPSLAAQIDAISLREDVTRITLKPLSREEMARLASSMLPLEAATLAHAVERSAGHPLFLVQLLRQWVASDELDADSRGMLSLRVQPASSSSRINEVVERRITSFISSLHRRSRVSSSVIRAMLECFAVVGENISFDMVSAIARREGISQLQIQEVWENALRDGLCYETTTEDCVQFTHPLVRSQLIEWARAQASYARRHLLCASAKLERGAGDPAQLHLELSEHLFEAGQATRAWRHLVYSARFALDMNRYRIARLRLRRALDLLPTLPNEEEQPISASERFDARRAYIDASLRLSMHEDVGEELLALLHDAGQESERIAWVRLFQSEWASSSDHSERAIQGFNEALQR